MKILFFGTPNFAAQVLDYLLENGIEVAAVISKPDKPKGRSGHPVPTPVKELVLSKYPSLPLFQPEIVSAPEFAETLKSFDADLFVVVAYGEILRQHVLDIPKKACINLHASLLPKYRGAAPIQRCIINGESESGTTVMHMVKKMDAGDMIDKAVVPITNDMTFGELEEELCNAGKQSLLKVIRQFENEIPICFAQDPEKVTFAPKIELEDCQIDWNKPAITIHNLVRGVNPYPGAWCFVAVKGEKKRMKVIRTTAVEKPSQTKPGQIIAEDGKKLVVGAGDGAIQILELQLEGKKAMKADEFLRGVAVDQLSFFRQDQT